MTNITASLLTSVAKGKAKLPAGLHCDSNGLYLQVTSTGAMSWLFRYTSPVTTKRRDLGLGSFLGLNSTAVVSLADARIFADEARALIRAGKCPVEARKAARAAAETAAAIPTFAVALEAFIASKLPKWKNADETAKRTRAQINNHAKRLSGQRVDMITLTDVVAVLKPLWPSKTGFVVQGIIENVLDACRTDGHIAGDNVARWDGHLEHKFVDSYQIKHHASMAAADLPAFMTALAASAKTVDAALRFLVLTATRSNEVLGAVWSEIDLDAKLWTIPAERMKMGTKKGIAHTVPLSDEAVALLSSLPVVEGNPYVFPGERKARLHGNAMQERMRALKIEGSTPHGFRSTFRDYMGDLHNPVTGAPVYDSQSLEFCLAHVLKGTEAAYRRGTSVAGRAIIMQVWANYATAKPANVTALKVAA